MQQYPFIFSDEPAYRLKRHLVFWTVWWLSQGFLYSFIAINSFTSYFIRLPLAILESLIFLLAHIFLTYSLIYFVIPRYLTKQLYWTTAIWVVILFFITAALSSLLSVTVIPYVRGMSTYHEYMTLPRKLPAKIFIGLMAGLRGAITIGGIACAIKLMKYWYIKEQRNLQLQRENVQSQLQLLKAQVHPHFLFNTLNNIYSYTQNTSLTASKLVMGLSEMIRYMLYECNQPLAPLSKEIKLLHDYCQLEKVRYDHQLDLQITMPAKDPELSIAPLLLLPLVENCFKHGASNLLEQAWINLSISTEGNRMKMKLVNSKPMDEKSTAENKKGIGIANVRARLELLYAGKYELSVTNERDVFIVNLTIELENQKALIESLVSPQKSDSYA